MIDTTERPSRTDELLHTRRRGPLASRQVRGLLATLAVLSAIMLLPTAGHPYDEAGLLGGANDWLQYGLPLYHASKFGADLTWLALLAEAGRQFWLWLGLSGVAAIHIAWKLPLCAAALSVGWALDALAESGAGLRQQLIEGWGPGLVWLVSPLTIWVAAAHGQVEPVGVAAVIVPLYLIQRPSAFRWAVAGVIAGLGVGIEYFPACILLAGFVLVVGRSASWRDFAALVTGTCTGTTVAFVPFLVSPTIRHEWLSALTGAVSTGSSPIPVASSISPAALSVWALLPGELAHPSVSTVVAVTGLAVAAAIAAYGWLASRGTVTPSQASVGLTGVVLILVVLLDPVTNYQFALIAAAGLLLLGIAQTRLPFYFVVWPPVLAFVGYLLYQSPWDFFYDLWAPEAHPSLFGLPVNTTATLWLSRGFLVGAVLALLWIPLLRLVHRGLRLVRPQLGMSASKRFASRMTSLTAGFATGAWLAVGVALSVVFCMLAGSPSIVAGVVAGGPGQLADLAGTSPMGQAVIGADRRSLVVSLSAADRFVTTATRKPRLSARLVPAPLETGRLEGADPKAVSVSSIDWINIPPAVLPSADEVQSYLLLALIGSPTWRTPAALPGARNVTLEVNQSTLHAESLTFSSSTWAVAAFSLPASIAGGTSIIIRPGVGFSRWDGWHGEGTGNSIQTTPASLEWSPSISVYAGSGSIHTGGGVDTYATTPSYQEFPTTQIDGPVLTSSNSLTAFDRLPFKVSTLLGTAIVWPRGQAGVPIGLSVASIFWMIALVVGGGTAVKRMAGSERRANRNLRP